MSATLNKNRIEACNRCVVLLRSESFTRYATLSNRDLDNTYVINVRYVYYYYYHYYCFSSMYSLLKDYVCSLCSMIVFAASMELAADVHYRTACAPCI